MTLHRMCLWLLCFIWECWWGLGVLSISPTMWGSHMWNIVHTCCLSWIMNWYILVKAIFSVSKNDVIFAWDVNMNIPMCRTQSNIVCFECHSNTGGKKGHQRIGSLYISSKTWFFKIRYNTKACKHFGHIFITVPRWI